MDAQPILKPVGLLLAAAIAGVACVGCGSGDENRTGPTTVAEQQRQTQSRIDDVKNNPHMTEAQKAAAMGAFSMNQGSTKH